MSEDASEDASIGASEQAADATAPPPHVTSLVVWDTPSPAAVSTVSTVKIGVRCESGCPLPAQTVEVRDSNSNVLGRGMLGSEPLAGTDALYGAEVRFTAPDKLGLAFRIAAFSAHNTSEPAHLDGSATFSFRTDPVPEHSVIVRVIHEMSSAPLENVEVRLDLYAGCTDGRGEARFELPGGRYLCSIRKAGYEADPVMLDIDRDLDLCVKAKVGLTREQFDERVSAYEDNPWG